MGTFSTSVDKTLIPHYKDILKEEDCIFLNPQYTFFQAKNKNWQITFYTSGKVVIQGKEIDYIKEKLFGIKEEKEIEENIPYPHIGVDESGKGDFFGPLVIAGCYLTEEKARLLKNEGADDSKKLEDKKILKLAEIIKENSIFDVVVIGNKKYNELYSKFKNLNRLLAWGHSTVFENILNKTECKIGISDKFGDEKLILNALKEKGRNLKLIQMPKAEKDVAVACASILARAEFCKKISKLSFDYGINLPKGAGESVLEQGKRFLSKYNEEELMNVAKAHFKTFEKIIPAQKSLF